MLHERSLVFIPDKCADGHVPKYSSQEASEMLTFYLYENFCSGLSVLVEDACDHMGSGFMRLAEVAVSTSFLSKHNKHFCVKV